ncbi:hypothetical protein [Halorubrum trapanicum]|uniref:hypothetical protein n=1 Tax=Halorubrum trapanicum TaxID=29284 RepID=UPI0012FD2CBB|nr:hypothetical protein [Halorubrum trapanicum]
MNRHSREEPSAVSDKVCEAALVLEISREAHDDHIYRRERPDKQNHYETSIFVRPIANTDRGEVTFPAGINNEHKHQTEHHERNHSIQTTEHHRPRREEGNSDYAGGIDRVLFWELDDHLEKLRNALDVGDGDIIEIDGEDAELERAE